MLSAWKSNLVFILAFAMALLAIFIAKLDTNFTLRWISFGTHLAAIALLFFTYLTKTISRSSIQNLKKTKTVVTLASVIVLAGITSFILLDSYPFVSIGDEVRDGGLNALQIWQGQIKNIFAYGRYNSHGLIIPTLTSFFYPLLGSSIFTYKLPAAILSFLDVILLFLLLYKLHSRTAAFFGALILASLPLHLFFARTQIVVMFNIFLTLVILLLLFNLLHKQRRIDYIMVGTIIGFAFGFHAALRVIAVLILFSLAAITIGQALIKVVKRKIPTDLLFNLVLLFFFLVVGFGPRTLFTTPDIFFHTSRLAVSGNGIGSVNIPNILFLGDRYLHSITVWGYTPIAEFFYHDPQPIFTPLIAFLFLVGIGFSAFILRQKFLNISIFLLFTTPLFNSALTDILNAEHRLSSLLPIGAIFAAIGAAAILNRVTYKPIKYVLAGTLIIYLLIQTNLFFIKQPANYDRSLKEYLSMHTIYFLQTNPQFFNEPALCLVVSQDNYLHFNYLHYREQYEYFLPHRNISFIQNQAVSDNQIHIFKNQCSSSLSTTKQQIIYCGPNNRFYCPLDYQGKIEIYY